jgi:hypothetical protein
MDPDATHARMIELADAHEADQPIDVDELASLVVSLDDWLRKGGFPPKAWAGIGDAEWARRFEESR